MLGRARDDHLRARIADDILRLVSRQGRVDRNADDSKCRASPVKICPFDAVVADDRDAISLDETHLRKSRRIFVHSPGEFGILDFAKTGPIVGQQRRAAAVSKCLFSQQVSKRGSFYHRQVQLSALVAI
jgi:hypothetical protein